MKHRFALRLAALTLVIAGASNAQSETRATEANEPAGVTGPAAAAATAPEPAPADEAKSAEAAAAEAKAREFFVLGDHLYAEGDYEAALRAFERAYAISGRPALRYNMANAHERLGQYREALVALVDYLPHVTGADAQIVQRRILQLDERDDEITTTNAWGYGLLGAGVASLGVGAYFGIKALSLQSDIKALCGQGPCPDTVQPIINDNDNAALAADITLAVSVIATGLGVYFILSSDKETSTVEAIQYSALPGGGEVSIVGTF